MLHFWLELAIFYPNLLSAANQQLFLRHWKRINLHTMLHPSMNYWFQYCDLH